MRGELPVAFVELREQADGSKAMFNEKELLAWCRARLAGYKVPDEIRVLDALPRNPTGKVMRRELKGLV
jgi:acyl-CoA synthetase (AMP-forming)/AMP-acid ligase II